MDYGDLGMDPELLRSRTANGNGKGNGAATAKKLALNGVNGGYAVLAPRVVAGSVELEASVLPVVSGVAA